MMIETLDKAYRANPFRPFTFRLADGRSLPVRHPEFLAFNPKGRIAIVIDEHDGAEFVDLLLVVSLSFEGTEATTETAQR
jgi:hypothetical protein